MRPQSALPTRPPSARAPSDMQIRAGSAAIKFQNINNNNNNNNLLKRPNLRTQPLMLNEMVFGTSIGMNRPGTSGIRLPPLRSGVSIVSDQLRKGVSPTYPKLERFKSRNF